MQNFTFTTHTSEEGNQLKMVFGGNLTLQTAAHIKQTLEAQKGDYASFTMTVKEVTGLDVSFLQIIESFKKMLEQEGKKLSIYMDLPYDLKNLLANAGISYPLK